MNKLLFLVFIAGIFGACVHHGDLYTSTKERIDNCVTSKAYTVPVREGYATIVMCGEDTLAVATEPISIQIPVKSNVLTRGSATDEIELKYEVLNGQLTYSQYWQAVLFEDTRSGDYDYNDLVLHIKNTNEYHHNGGGEKSYKTLKVLIQPIALGSMKKIKLGCIVTYDKTVHIISEDVRKDFFGNATGYINTESEKAPVRYKLEERLSDDYGLPVDKNNGTLAWFIEVDGNRFFAVSSDLEYEEYDMLNTEGMPYGLVFYGNNGEQGTFAYPEEKTSIFEAYPSFRDWINKNANSVGGNVKKLLYRYSYDRTILGSDGKKHTIWDWQDLQ